MDRSNTPVIAGTLTVVSAAFGLLGGLMFFLLSLLFMGMAGEFVADPETDAVFNIVTLVYMAIGVIFIIAGILSVIGGIFSFKRTHWGWALAGAIAGIITFFPVGIPAVVFMAQSKKEFIAPLPETSPAPVPEKTTRPMTGGVLLIVAAGFSLLGAVAMGAYSVFIPDMFFPMAGMAADEATVMSGLSEFMSALYLGWAVLMLVAAVLSLVGGLYALKRRNWAWALTGSIAAVAGFFPVGIAAIILVAQAKKEFAPNNGSSTLIE